MPEGQRGITVMRVLLVNKFLYPKGGDAISTLNTEKLLKSKGHDVILWGMEHHLNSEFPYQEFFTDNIDYEKPEDIKEKINITLKMLYSLEAKTKMEGLIKAIRPDIVHLNNFAHQISPSILDVIAKYMIPVVMTMRDYKLVCPSYSMLLNGKPCEKCKNSKYYQCFLNKCTKDSYLKSLINTIEMYLHHKILYIYDKIDIFISPSRFLKEKLIKMGFKKDIVYLPNFISTNDYLPEYNSSEKTICYFGRLSPEKGLFTLIEAMEKIDAKLKIIGDGPIKENLKLKVKSKNLNNVNFLGYKTGDKLKSEIKNSIAVFLPSECYENNPRTVLEAFALGKPVIGSRIGGIPELVKDGKTGFTFEAGNSEDLKDKILHLLKDPDKIVQMGKNARKFVEEDFNSEKHYQELMKIYEMAIDRNGRETNGSSNNYYL